MHNQTPPTSINPRQDIQIKDFSITLYPLPITPLNNENINRSEEEEKSKSATEERRTQNAEHKQKERVEEKHT